MVSTHFELKIPAFSLMHTDSNAFKMQRTKQKRKKEFSNLFSLWLLSAVVIIHKCYQTYCEFRLKMHFVPINM